MRSIKSECLRRVIPLGERHLRTLTATATVRARSTAFVLLTLKLASIASLLGCLSCSHDGAG